jgi:hypothetical protein
MTVIEIRRHRCGWKAFESPGVEPVFPKEGSGNRLRALRSRRGDRFNQCFQGLGLTGAVREWDDPLVTG